MSCQKLHGAILLGRSQTMTTKLAKAARAGKRLSVTLSHAGDIKRWEELRQTLMPG